MFRRRKRSEAKAVPTTAPDVTAAAERPRIPLAADGEPTCAAARVVAEAMFAELRPRLDQLAG